MSTSARPEPTDPADASRQAPADLAAGAVRQGPRRVLVVWTVVLAVLVLVLDQLTKWWAESSLTLGDDTIPLVGPLLGLRLIYNPGAALSIATGMTWLLTIVVVAVVVVIVRMVSRIGSRAWAVALGLLLGGALGNLVDRFFPEPAWSPPWRVPSSPMPSTDRTAIITAAATIAMSATLPTNQFA